MLIPIPKPGKYSRNPGKYRQDDLTSCLEWKTIEGMVNGRLVWFLEKKKPDMQCSMKL